MDEAPFSNREIREFVGEIKKDISEIKTQTQKTNGRVNSLENWKWFLSGGLAILSVLVVPVLIYFIQSSIK